MESVHQLGHTFSKNCRSTLNCQGFCVGKISSMLVWHNFPGRREHFHLANVCPALSRLCHTSCLLPSKSWVLHSMPTFMINNKTAFVMSAYHFIHVLRKDCLAASLCARYLLCSASRILLMFFYPSKPMSMGCLSSLLFIRSRPCF